MNKVSKEEIVDVCPKIEINTESLFQRIELLRDQVYLLLSETLEQYRLNGEITRSSPYEYETFVLIRLWKKDANDGSQQYRGEAKINITANPSRRYPLEMQLVAESGGKKRVINKIIRFDQKSASDLVEFISQPGTKLRKSSFGRYGLIINRNWFVKRPGQFRMYAIYLIPVLSTLAFEINLVAGFLAVLLGLMPFIFILRNERERIVIAGRPPQNPRKLIRMDSWQSVVIDLGEMAAKIKTEVKHELVDGKHTDAMIQEEEVAYLAPTGKTERKQIVINFRRAVAFIEIHSYGNDLYVDWEAYLNLGIWAETDAGSGYDAKNKSRIIYKEMTRSVEAFNEYDLSDANFLIEWVHACLTRVVRRLKKEKHIDQEFDFRIQRSDRKAVLKEGQDTAISARRSFMRKS